MVSIPSLSRRSEPTEPAKSTESAKSTGTAPAKSTDTAPKQRGTTTTTGGPATPGTTTTDTRVDPARTRTDDVDRARADGTAVTDPATRPAPPGPRPEPPTREDSAPRPTPPPAPAGPRPRASMLATLSLMTGIVGALFVLSGALAPYGIAIGVVALAFGLGGISATARRHIAGRTEALIGIVLALGTMLVGSLALTGSLSWLTTEMDTVSQVRQWLDSQFAGIF
ncbi:hypothetical protein [Micromonospora sp. LOL_023]|uniref:hypothetical protein n=1 Tax=Micromonospora sp. LOL_023 TaxID=3345418 RepID=UPI003A8C1EC7